MYVKSLKYLVVELAEAALQIQRARVAEFGEYLQMGNQLSVRNKTIPTQSLQLCEKKETIKATV